MQGTKETAPCRRSRSATARTSSGVFPSSASASPGTRTGTSSGAFPLAGIRIVAVEQYAAGPFSTLQLADLGAEVIKIENARDSGDVSRHVRHPDEPLERGDSMFHQAFNRNKRSITLDLKHPKGQDVLHRLIGTEDATFNNLRGDLPEKLGLTYDALEGTNERIVCVHLSAYGRDNERAGWPGYDYSMQAECGYLSVTGEPDGRPTRMGLSLVDMSAGLQAGIAMVSGILGARATGRGGEYDISLFSSAVANLSYVGAWYLTAGANTGRQVRSAHPNLTPSQIYRTKDGWIFIMCNRRLREQGETASWATLRSILAGQQRVTATFRRQDGRVLHVRKATRAERVQLNIYKALGLDPQPGRTARMVV